MRCLILGSSGLLGSQLTSVCDSRQLPWLGTCYSRHRPFLAPLDLRDAQAVNELLADYEPDVTFLAADTDFNSFRKLTQSLKALGSKLVLFTPAQVFGHCTTARRETDRLMGTCELARHKIALETIAQEQLGEQCLVLRTSHLFGPETRPTGMLSQWMARWEQGEPVAVCDQKLMQPTFAPDLARVAVDLVQSNFMGTIHVVGQERHTEFSFARLSAHLLGYDMDLVEARQPIADAGSPWLDRRQMREKFGPKVIRSTADGLRALRQPVAQPALKLLRAA